jgi:lambda family phage portal protein
MMKFIRKFFGAKPAEAAGSPQKRSYHGAQMGLTTSSWSTTGRSQDADLRNDLNALRARSRDLAKNNDYMRSFLAMTSANVVGHNGFSLQMRVKDPSGKVDDLANRAIEQGFAKWAKRKNCDLSGKLSFSAMQRLVIRTVARDGECIVRKIRDRRLNPFGFGLQIISIDRLDVSLNQLHTNGNAIRMGVEINSYGRPVAYHLLTVNPGDGIYMSAGGKRYERVLAEDIDHLFIQEDPEQTRGVPWAVSAMTRLNHLGAFDEAAVIAARIGASKMGFYKKTSENPMAGMPGAEAADAGEFVQDASPGEFGVLPDGYDFVSFNPDYPHANYAPFTKACLRGIAAGLGVNYNSLANDLESVNYSSLRAGTLAERDQWMTIQDWFGDVFIESVFEDWLRMSLLMGALTMPNMSALPASKFDKFNASQWQGRRWPWVDPLKDVQASVLAINNLLNTRTRVQAEQGQDFADTAAQWAEEQSLMAGYGIQTGTNITANVMPVITADEEDAPPNNQAA